jgi:trimethylamine--corrinoid protein Co-methyltransferase
VDIRKGLFKLILQVRKERRQLYTTKSLYSQANYEVNQTISWKMLSDDQCENIFLTALEILERTGVEIANKEALDLFEKAGCWVDDNRVRIPSSLTEWAVRTAPSRITICDRNGKRALSLETTNVYFGPGYENVNVLDPLTGSLRKPVKDDVVNCAIVCDALKNIDFAMSNGQPTDVNPALAEVHAFEALVSNTTKPVVQSVKTLAQAQAVVDIASSIAGGLRELQKNPFLVLHIQTEGTLIHSDETMAKVIFAAQNGIPFIYNTKLIAGDTAPATPAGAIVLALADVLTGTILSQLVRQGAHIIAGGLFTIDDQDNEILPLGAPEVELMGTGFANVLRHLRLPNFGFAGATDAKISDAQMGLESAFSILHAGLSGTNLIHGCGQMEYGLTGSLELLVMGDEAMGMTRRIMKGIETNEERLARGVIDAVQPGGHYLGEEHTMKYFRSEVWWPTLMNRKRIDDWKAEGAKPMGQRVKEKTQDLLKNHLPTKLTADKVAEIQAIVAKAEASLK